jgi:hypothetical protein
MLRLSTISVFLLIMFFTYIINAQETIYNLLPDKDCVAIEISGEPELYVGDDLFNLINGGAELYHELGFLEVLAFELIISGNGPVKTEIYDMGSSDGAWGIFSLTSTSKAKKEAIGDAARKGEGFLQFIQDKYMVYMYFSDIAETELQVAAACIEDQISTSSEAPEIMSIISEARDTEGRIVYFQGNLGLQSIYSFHYKDIFGYEEGAAVIYDDLKVFLLDYEDKAACLEKYESSSEFLLNSSKYHDQTSLAKSIHLKDKKERQIDCFFEDTFLLIFIYSGELEIDDLREQLAGKMNTK